eukprot:8405946-Alexandrium_andersonii.AAC.1
MAEAIRHPPEHAEWAVQDLQPPARRAGEYIGFGRPARGLGALRLERRLDAGGGYPRRPQQQAEAATPQSGGLRR